MRQLAALSSIGFAVGSQKLFLNIRHEFKVRDDAPKSLAIALATFGGIYATVCLMAGPSKFSGRLNIFIMISKTYSHM